MLGLILRTDPPGGIGEEAGSTPYGDDDGSFVWVAGPFVLLSSLAGLLLNLFKLGIM